MTEWPEIEGFVAATLEQVAGRVPYARRELELALIRYVTWGVTEEGLDLAAAVLFEEAAIAYGITRAYPGMSAPSRGNRRSMLLAVARVLLPTLRMPRIRSADPTGPYTSSQLAGFRFWANGQRTPTFRRSAKVLLALGAGAGLSTGEIDDAEPADVLRDGADIWIRVRGPRVREVPLRAEWAPVLTEALADAPSDLPLFRNGRQGGKYENAVTNFVARSAGTGLKPTGQRLRATWIVGHLDESTRLVDLVQWAGVRSLTSFERYLRFAAPPMARS